MIKIIYDYSFGQYAIFREYLSAESTLIYIGTFDGIFFYVDKYDIKNYELIKLSNWIKREEERRKTDAASRGCNT